MPFKAKNNREAVVVCAIHVVKRPSKRSVLVKTKLRNRLSVEHEMRCALSQTQTRIKELVACKQAHPSH